MEKIKTNTKYLVRITDTSEKCSKCKGQGYYGRFQKYSRLKLISC